MGRVAAGGGGPTRRHPFAAAREDLTEPEESRNMASRQQDPGDVEEILRLQDEAMALLERLRVEEPLQPAHVDHMGGGRRDFRRWPPPEGVTLEMHDGLRWHRAECTDMGVGGARVNRLPFTVKGPVPARLKAPGIATVLVLSDVMWREGGGNDVKAGLRFEFQDDEERDQWSGGLIDALLARHALA
jgi:hypothetical protein